MRILHVIDSINLRQGGPSVSVPALAAAQAKLGHEVTIACRDYGYLGPIAKAEGVSIRTVPGSKWTKGQGGWGCGFRKLVGEEAKKADVVHNHGVWLAANYYARWAANKAGKPLVISPRGMVEDWSLGRSKMRKRVAWWLFERENLRSAKLFHATSGSEAESISEALRRWKMVDGRWEPPISELRSPITTGPRIVVAANGVDVPENIPGREVLEKIFPKMKGKKWLVFMSRVHPKKGLLELAEAWMSVREKYSEWELVIAGPQDDRGYAEKMKRVLEGEGVWTGELAGEKKWCALGNAGFVALPSHSENFGIVVAEALAAGRPALTTTGTPWGAAKLRGDGILAPSDAPPPILVSRSARGYLSADAGELEMGDGGDMNLERRGCGVICEVEGVKGALEKMLGFSDAQRDEMGTKGAKWMREEFSWESAAQRLVEAYRGITKP